MMYECIYVLSSDASSLKDAPGNYFKYFNYLHIQMFIAVVLPPFPPPLAHLLALAFSRCSLCVPCGRRPF